QQQLLFDQARNLMIAILGDEKWLQAASADGANLSAFANALISDLGATSEQGVRLSPAERTALLNLPAPDGLNLDVRTALLDRFDRFAAGGITDTEQAAVQSAGNALSATSTELKNRGWSTMCDGLKTTWRQVGEQFDQARRGQPLRARALFYKLVDEATGFVRQGRLNNMGQLEALRLAADRDYLISYLD